MGNETFEKLGTVGASANLLVYLTTIFNMKSITATNLINVFHVHATLGMLVLTLSAAVKTLHPPHCVDALCVGPTPWQMAFLLAGFTFMIIGASGIRPCNLAFGVDQFNPNTESGKKGITSFFNWYYFTFTVCYDGVIDHHRVCASKYQLGHWPSNPTFFIFVSCVMFFVGTRIYVIVQPNDSPLTNIIQS
ncbi:putative proton-dependent oligopeptide transporter family [Helianthus annuus]|nr:putative proton-dependent oligopeptide transporter family [Helianthus annuus]